MSKEHPTSINIGIGQLVVTAPAEAGGGYYHTNRAKGLDPKLDGLVTLDELEQLAQWIKDEQAEIDKVSAEVAEKAAAAKIVAQKAENLRKLTNYHQGLVDHYERKLLEIS